jgi:cellulose synthase/poly-beta-1,6-N-acetylglucosamine synthase-like glycosyltransferase
MMESYLIYIEILLLFFIVVYLRQNLFFYRGLARLKHGTNTFIHSITVIIPARNEEANIERCLRTLMAQEYPPGKLSIIIIDDQSTDRTAAVVESLIPGSPFPITLLRSDITSTIRSPKIRAMTLGIQHSSSEIIVTTDADCTVGPRWISSINSYFEERVGLVTGLTVYEHRTTGSPMFYGMQFLDFVSYTAVAAGVIGMGRVLVSNGSNMAFRIQTFDECGGFETLTHINTGDDSLLAQKLVASGQWEARFAYADDAVVETQPVDTWQGVLRQRIRWVGQTSYYPAYMMFFMICTFIMFVLLTVMLPLSYFYWTPVPYIVLGGKYIGDYLVMRRFTNVTHLPSAMRYFIPTWLIHIPSILISTVGGYFFSFEWKERTMTKESR